MRPTTFLQSINLRLCGLILVLLQLGSAQEASFRITPQRPVEELRAEAFKAQPPREQGTFLKPNLLELVKLDLDFQRLALAKSTGKSLGTIRKQFIDRQPMGRLGTPVEVAMLAVYLASDEASYTTGQIHLADGGFAL